MGSQSLQSLTISIDEVSELNRANIDTIGIRSINPILKRAIGRAAVVLLCGHFERYIYGVNEEVSDFINSNNVTGNNLPENLRLVHSKHAIEEIAEMQWNNRANKLQDLMTTEYWLWSHNQKGELIPDRLLEWMKSPNPANIIRYYKYWSIEDIFAAITRDSHTRRSLWLRIQELVDKRNNIAHGDTTTEANKHEIVLYSKAVLTFCERADRMMSKQIRRLFKISPLW